MIQKIIQLLATTTQYPDVSYPKQNNLCGASLSPVEQRSFYFFLYVFSDKQLTI